MCDGDFVVGFSVFGNETPLGFTSVPYLWDREIDENITGLSETPVKLCSTFVAIIDHKLIGGI